MLWCMALFVLSLPSVLHLACTTGPIRRSGIAPNNGLVENIPRTKRIVTAWLVVASVAVGSTAWTKDAPVVGTWAVVWGALVVFGTLLCVLPWRHFRRAATLRPTLSAGGLGKALCVLCVVLYCQGLFSNSFIEAEATVVHFLLLSVCAARVLEAASAWMGSSSSKPSLQRHQQATVLCATSWFLLCGTCVRWLMGDASAYGLSVRGSVGPFNSPWLDAHWIWAALSVHCVLLGMFLSTSCVLWTLRRQLVGSVAVGALLVTVLTGYASLGLFWLPAVHGRVIRHERDTVSFARYVG